MINHFRCGHPREGNTTGLKEKRCKICAYKQHRSWRDRQSYDARQDRNTNSYAKQRDSEPVEGTNPDEKAMPRMSRSLLTAIYRSHPYVFDAAERSGRLAVRP